MSYRTAIFLAAFFLNFSLLIPYWVSGEWFTPAYWRWLAVAAPLLAVVIRQACRAGLQ